MDINDPRIGPLCLSSDTSWMVFRAGSLYGERGKGEGSIFLNKDFHFHVSLKTGFIGVDTFSLPKEYAL